jgi:predicted NBD/HSP70 family sugar kinase
MRGEVERWRAAADVLALVAREPGITRADAARRLGLSSGSATEITGRLRELALLGETPAPVRGRGRPTSVLTAHPAGPLVLGIELRHEDWRCALAGVDGRAQPVASGRHGRRDPASVLAALRRAVLDVHAEHADRLRAVSLAVAGTVRGDRVVQAAGLGWADVDPAGLTAGTGADLLLGNDATLAAVAEARDGAGTGARCGLHLVVEVGVGGALVADGLPVAGAAGGEYGHLPLGDRALRCPCGARGCWDLEVDGRALARHLGVAPPADPRTFARGVLDRSDAPARAAVRRVAGALAAGVAGLVNAHDPDVVTLGGLAGPLRAAAPDAFAAAYADGLMAFHRAAPPPVRDAAHGDAGPLRGALAVAIDRITGPAALAGWAARRA